MTTRQTRNSTPIKAKAKSPAKSKVESKVKAQSRATSFQGPIFVQDKQGFWLEASIMASKSIPDSELSEDHLENNRKPWHGKRKSLSGDVALVLGAWLLVHYVGYKATSDEWVRYAVGGPVCTMEHDCCCARSSTKETDSAMKRKRGRPRKNKKSKQKRKLQCTSPKRQKANSISEDEEWDEEDGSEEEGSDQGQDSDTPSEDVDQDEEEQEDVEREEAAIEDENQEELEEEEPLENEEGQEQEEEVEQEVEVEDLLAKAKEESIIEKPVRKSRSDSQVSVKSSRSESCLQGDSYEVTPPMILALQVYMEVPMSDVFRIAKLEGGQVNAAYCWMKKENMHRAAIQNSGTKLTAWFRSFLKKDPLAKKSVLANQKIVKKREEQARALVEEKKKQRLQALELKPQSPSGLGVRLLSRSNLWEASVSVVPSASPIVLGQFTTSADATKAVDVATKAIESRMKELAVGPRSIGNCSVCGGKEGSKNVCHLCQASLQQVAVSACDVAGTRSKRRKPDTSLFPVSDCFIRSQKTTKKFTRRPDLVDQSSNSQWLGPGFPDGGIKTTSRFFYTKFRFLDSPDDEFQVLDHVLLFRITPDGLEEEDEETEHHASSPNRARAHSIGSKAESSPDFYIGQIEAMWEESDGDRKARIAWFFWPQETDFYNNENPDEVFTSSEVDVVPLSSIARKVRVLCRSEYDAVKSGLSKAPPSPAQRRNSLTNRQVDLHSMTSENPEKPIEAGVLLRAKHRHSLDTCTTTLFAQRHFHHRAGIILGDDHASKKDFGALDAWLHSFVRATYANPCSISLLDEKDANNVCYAHHEPPSYRTEMKESTKRCAFCFEPLAFLGHIECSVCPSTCFCLNCFSMGRQGLIKTPDGTAVIHRSAHPYKVPHATMDYSHPTEAMEALKFMCKTKGLACPQPKLIAVLRGPLLAKETRGVGSMFLYGLMTDFAQPENRGSKFSSKLGPQGLILGSRYGKTVEEAVGMAAVDALHGWFGTATILSVPVLSSEWTAKEALRLVDSLKENVLAWELAEEVVGCGKSASDCAEFFYCNLHPFWASRSEWAHKMMQCKDSDEMEYLGNLPPPSEEAVGVAVEDAMRWAIQVHNMLVRRCKVSRRNARGLAFAVVEGQTVFAKRPGSFGNYTTDASNSILKEAMSVDELVEAAGDKDDDLQVIRRTSDSEAVCLKCKSHSGANTILLCDGCDAEYHIGCLNPPLSTVPEADWFCSDCMTDREYFYHHESWGASGGTLCKLVKQNGVGDDTEWKMRLKEWQDNDKILSRASKNAIEKGFGSSRGKKRKRNEETPVAAKRGIREDTLSANQQKIEFAWASRHYASTSIATLEAANRGLAETLVHVLAQRDALLGLVNGKKADT